MESPAYGRTSPENGETAAGTGEAIAALYRFMRGLLVWKKKYDALFEPRGTHPHAPVARRKPSEIYLKYLTQRERKTGRPRSCHGKPAHGIRSGPGTGERAEVLKAGKVLITAWWHHPPRR
jgi:hypothetical protein